VFSVGSPARAYIHSVMVQERRGMLRVWNLSLLCATFSLTILETFLTRSGVLDSVHSFSESDIGPWLLSFFGLVDRGHDRPHSDGRGDRLRSPGTIDRLSKRADRPNNTQRRSRANSRLFVGNACCRSWRARIDRAR